MSDFVRFIEAFVSHPLHPRLVHFPIALSYLGLLLVVVAWLRKDAFFERVAFYVMALLTLSVIPAALTGILENQTLYVGNAPNGSLKVALAAALFLIAAAATLWRWRQPQLLNVSVMAWFYVLAFAVCVGLTTFLGALGGIIVWGA
jgi:uncharacterized membrane protein